MRSWLMLAVNSFGSVVMKANRLTAITLELAEMMLRLQDEPDMRPQLAVWVGLVGAGAS